MTHDVLILKEFILIIENYESLPPNIIWHDLYFSSQKGGGSAGSDNLRLSNIKVSTRLDTMREESNNKVIDQSKSKNYGKKSYLHSLKSKLRPLKLNQANDLLYILHWSLL